MARCILSIEFTLPKKSTQRAVMRQCHVLLLATAILLAHCHVAFGNSGQSKLERVNLTHPGDHPETTSPVDVVSAAYRNQRYLRSFKNANSEGIIATEDEDRAIDLKKFFDYKKFFGMRDVPKEFANGVVNEFSRATINEMLKNKKFRFAVFKKWDNVNIDELAMKIGEATPHNKRVVRMFVDYRHHHRNYKWPVGR